MSPFEGTVNHNLTCRYKFVTRLENSFATTPSTKLEHDTTRNQGLRMDG